MFYYMIKRTSLFFQGNESKAWVSLNKISKYVINSTIYTEDKHFYEHKGFDYTRIVKAGMINIASRSTKQGASTITQQYAKNLFLDFDKTWKRKWDEMWYTMRIENNYSKDEILEGYLNTINYGHGMYGIENASEFYFNKKAKDLDLAEAAMITGIPKSPSNYSPLVDFDTAKKRQLLIFKYMALIGGRNYNTSSYNRATSAKRQVGSSMKPYLYYAALENGFTSSTSFTSQKTTFNLSNNQTYSPKNNNDVYGNKPISMATAIAYSENIYAVKTHLFLGEDTLVNMAKKVGITEKLQAIPSLPLGTNEINIMEMAGGYSAFANLGYKVKPHLIKKIEDKDGNVLYEYKQEKTKVLDSSLCFILNNMLTATYDADYIDYNYPTAIGIASRMTHKYSLKSGTTSTDNWNIGFNPDVLTAVWVGYDDNTELKSSEYKYSQNIWLTSMEDYLKDKPDNWYDVPDNVSTVLVEPISGRSASESDSKKKLMYFIKGTEPTDSDPVFDEKLNDSTAS